MVQIALDISKGFFLLPLSPAVFLVVLILIGVQNQRAKLMERSVFGQRINHFFLFWWGSFGMGTVLGLLFSAGVYFARHYLSFEWSVTMSLWLWGTLVILALVDVRLADIAYAGPLLTLVFAILEHFGLARAIEIPMLNLRSLLFVTGGIQILSGIFGVLYSGYKASPIYVESKRGQVVGAFILQYFWPVPLLLPSHGVLLPMALVTGQQGVSVASLPAKLTRQKGIAIAVTGFIVALLTLLTGSNWILILVVALVALGLRAGTLTLLQWMEWNQLPFFSCSARGVRVLATVKGSPAEKLGLLPGEVISKVGSLPVHSPYDIHFAIDQNSAYVKLEVIDIRGEIRFIGTPLFANGPSQLGVVIVPENPPARGVYAFGRWVTLWRWWTQISKKDKHPASASYGISEAHTI